MAVQYSIQKMVSDGTLSTIALGIQYLQRNDIYIRIAGEDTPQSGAPSGYTWSFVNSTTLKILPVVPNGIEVVVYRRTDINAMYNIYSQNAQFDEATIDENNQQLLYIAQEYLEQGIPGAGIDTIEFLRDDGTNTYYRIKRTDGSYSDEFAVPSSGTYVNILVREAMRRSYAAEGYNLVDGSFQVGFTLVYTYDVALDEATGQAFSGPAGTYPAGTSTASFKNRRKVLPRKVNPITRGADPAGIVESTAAILLADADAVALGVRLEFTGGTYLVDEITVSSKLVRAAPGHEVVLQYKGGGNTKTVLKGSGVDGQTFEGIIADGACSADPVAWTPSNYDAFTGAAGFEISNSNGPKMISCHARNTQRRGLRFVGCANPLWRDCTQKRARGEFGDGFMAVDCIGTVRENCHAEDYTRIGHVDDTFGDSPKTSYGIKYVNVTANNGHDASALYGGTEFNSGTWSENVGSLSMVNVSTWNNVHRQVNICSGVKNNGYTAPTAIFDLENVNTDGGIWGIYTYSLAGLPVTVKKTNCTAINAARPFEDEARYGGDSFSSVNCHAVYDMTKGGVNARAYTFSTVGSLSGLPSFSYSDCTFSRINESLTNLNNATSASAAADIGANPATSAPVRLHVHNVKNAVVGSTYLRINANSSHIVTVSGGIELSVSYCAMLGGSLTIDSSCSIKLLTLTDDQLFICRMNGCRIRGQVKVTAENIDAVGISVDIDTTEYVWLLSNKTGNYPAINLSAASLRKDINANGSVLRLGFGTVSFTALLSGLMMYNKGSASASNSFVRYATGTVRVWSNTYADNTVTNITQLDSGGGNENTLAGVAKIAMH